MFRNCLRRPPLQSFTRAIVSPPNFPQLPKPDRSGGFVCASCQVRALASGARRARGTRAPSFLGAIKRLEAHVQSIERAFADRIKKSAATQALPDVELTEDMKDQAYAALMAPWDPTAAFLPAPTPVSDLLPTSIVHRLEGSKYLVETDRPKWGSVLEQLELNGGLHGLTVSDVNGLVLCMDNTSRAQNSSKVWDLMLEAGLEPDTFTYDLMMLAHAGLAQSVEVKAFFQDMKQRGVSPTVYTFAHLLEAYACEADVLAAAAAFEEMQSSGITPNIVVYTTLIKTCINGRKLQTAWQIFNLMKLRSSSTAPDLLTYTLMLKACGIEGESEKALDLHVDMTVRRGLELNQEAYGALIHAMAVRKDYVPYAWKFATEMQRGGFVMDRNILNELVLACGKNGDLMRARMLIRHMMANGKEEVVPDNISFQCLFRAYGATRLQRRLNTHSTRTLGSVDDPQLATREYVGPDTKHEKKLEELDEDVIPFYNVPTLGAYKDIMAEAKLVMYWLCAKRPELVDTQLANAYLDIYIDQGGYWGFKAIYFTLFSDPDPASYLPSVSPFTKRTLKKAIADAVDIKPRKANYWGLPYAIKIPRNLYTFDQALDLAIRARDLDFGRIAWRDRLEFICTEPYLQVKPATRRRFAFSAERHMISLLAKCGLLGKAVEWLRAASKTYTFYPNDVYLLQVRALQLGDLETLKALRVLVPAKPHKWNDGLPHYPRHRSEYKTDDDDGLFDDEPEDLSKTY